MSRPKDCRLRTLEGIDDPYSWNKDMLEMYFVQGECKGHWRIDNRRNLILRLQEW
jgi:hypothetical protein